MKTDDMILGIISRIDEYIGYRIEHFSDENKFIMKLICVGKTAELMSKGLVERTPREESEAIINFTLNELVNVFIDESKKHRENL